LKNFLVDLKSNKTKYINYILSPEFIELIDRLGELLADIIAQEGLDTTLLDSYSTSPGPSNPELYNAGSSNPESSNPRPSSSGPSNSGQSESSGPNRGNNSVTPTANDVFNNHVKDTANKLQDLYFRRPYRAEIYMNSLEYSDRITEMDHNVLCSHVMDTDVYRWRRCVTLDPQGRVRYNGVLTRNLMVSLKAKADSL
jgi:hypothetical protein